MSSKKYQYDFDTSSVDWNFNLYKRLYNSHRIGVKSTLFA